MAVRRCFSTLTWRMPWSVPVETKSALISPKQLAADLKTERNIVVLDSTVLIASETTGFDTYVKQVRHPLTMPLKITDHISCNCNPANSGSEIFGFGFDRRHYVLSRCPQPADSRAVWRGNVSTWNTRHTHQNRALRHTRYSCMRCHSVSNANTSTHAPNLTPTSITRVETCQPLRHVSRHRFHSQEYFHLRGHGSHFSLWAMTRTRSDHRIHSVILYSCVDLGPGLLFVRLDCSGVCSGWRAACMGSKWIRGRNQPTLCVLAFVWTNVHMVLSVLFKVHMMLRVY